MSQHLTMPFRLLSTDADFFFPFSAYTIHTSSAWNSSAEEDEQKKTHCKRCKIFVALCVRICTCLFTQASRSCPETLLNVLLAWVLEFGMFSRVHTPCEQLFGATTARTQSCAQDVQRQTDAVCLCLLLAAAKPKRTRRAHARAN